MPGRGGGGGGRFDALKNVTRKSPTRNTMKKMNEGDLDIVSFRRRSLLLWMIPFLVAQIFRHRFFVPNIGFVREKKN